MEQAKIISDYFRQIQRRSASRRWGKLTQEQRSEVMRKVAQAKRGKK